MEITLTTIILGLLLILAVYIIVNQYYKIIKYEELANDSQISFENSKTLLNKLLKLYIEAKHRMDRVDKGGSFSSDDEVGFAFKLINTTISELNVRLQEFKDILDGKSSEE